MRRKSGYNSNIKDGVNWFSEDGNVEAAIEVYENRKEKIRSATIYEFSSLGPKRAGVARNALKEMRKTFNYISAIGIGRYPSDLSWKFWVQMKKEGLVNRLEDDEGRVV